MKSLELVLPFPPSLNSYYRTFNNRILISKKGREYRKEIIATIAVSRCKTFQASCRLKVAVTIHAPDRRRRDLDNTFKCLGDSLMQAGIFADDSQIDDLRIIRGEVKKGDGMVVVKIEEIEEIENDK